ncbi:MAG TPA: hypothetical protein VHS96_06280 [Bacteroidia bacterium]|nr:hypothetical protein [Bacteroidia bacterium]
MPVIKLQSQYFSLVGAKSSGFSSGSGREVQEERSIARRLPIKQMIPLAMMTEVRTCRSDAAEPSGKPWNMARSRRGNAP